MGAITHKSKDKFLEALFSYTKAKNLDWKWVKGYDNHARALPVIQQEHAIQVIIPFKDQKELTLRCVQCALKQSGVKVNITAVDNDSQDQSISRELQALGIEVITIREPFNYSRLNNLAVQQTTNASHCDLLLFLNNDVELEENALIEMVRWIDQPQIGMVGCRLHYPDGRLQHGGVYLDYSEQPKHEMHWENIEKFCTLEQMQVTKKLGIVDAVTAACALIKRSIFWSIGGFDEIWYPIGYSDTNLAVKLNRIGLKCFYTPYAFGTHYESISRQESIEDYENSRWLHQLLLENKQDFTIHTS